MYMHVHYENVHGYVNVKDVIVNLLVTRDLFTFLLILILFFEFILLDGKKYRILVYDYELMLYIHTCTCICIFPCYL